MHFDPSHIVLALTIFALTAPALGLMPASARAAFPLGFPAAPLASAHLAVEPTPPATQIARLDAIVSAAVAKARHAEQLHHSAHEQVDAADYALQGLKNELAAISGRLAGSVPVRAVPARGIQALPRHARTSALAA